MYGITGANGDFDFILLQGQSSTYTGFTQYSLLPPPFNDFKYKKDLINTIIACNFSFTTV